MNIGFFLFCFFCLYILWAICGLSIVIFKWLKSYFLNINNKENYIDLRQNKEAQGKNIIISVVKPNPPKGIWFGHIWIIWPDAPPLANGEKEAGFYAHSKIEATKKLIGAILSPFSFITGHKPIKGIMRDDSGLQRDWVLIAHVDDDIYDAAIKIDNKWRNETNYSLHPQKCGKTISCRDYCLEIAQEIGLKARFDKWAQFPPETFRDFLIENNILPAYK